MLNCYVKGGWYQVVVGVVYAGAGSSRCTRDVACLACAKRWRAGDCQKVELKNLGKTADR